MAVIFLPFPLISLFSLCSRYPGLEEDGIDSTLNLDLFFHNVILELVGCKLPSETVLISEVEMNR